MLMTCNENSREVLRVCFVRVKNVCGEYVGISRTVEEGGAEDGDRRGLGKKRDMEHHL